VNSNRNPNSSACFESLETRRMFSASQVGGTVFIEGTNSAETVTVSEFISNSELSLGVRFLQIKETTHRPFLPDITRTTNIQRSTVSRLRVNSFGGNDVITLNTSVGADVYAGAGSDRISGSSGSDRLFGDLSIVSDFDGREIGPGLLGTPGKDVMFGNGGNDLLQGGAGDDTLVGGAGFDRMLGEAGNDFINSRDGVGNEQVDGGAGFDIAQIDNQFAITALVRDSVINVEKVTT
jgi:Ca2+-binding RTX toxin-like protein